MRAAAERRELQRRTWRNFGNWSDLLPSLMVELTKAQLEDGMALKDYLGVIDNALKHVFDRKPVDPAKARRPMLRAIDRTLAQYKTGSAGTSTGWYRIRNGVVALTVKVAGNTLDINGAATNHLPADRFEEFLDHMRAAVDAGEFDGELANKGHGGAEVGIPTARASSISPEAAKLRGVKAAATRKANREKAKPS